MLQISSESLDRLLDAADKAILSGDHAQAEVLARQVLSLQPRHARACYRLGLSLALRNRHAEALEPFRQSTELDPGNPDFWHDLAFTLATLRRPAEALAAFESALAAAPGHIRSRRGLAMVLTQEAKFDEARRHYQQLVEREPKNPDIWFEHGRMLLSAGYCDDAVQAYQKALSLKPDHADAQHEMGIALEINKRQEEALAAFESALALNPRHIGALNNLGNLYKNMGRLSDALAAFERAVACGPDVPATRNNLGALLILMGRGEEALVHYRRGMTANPDFHFVRSGYLYCRQFLAGADRRIFFEEHRQWQKTLGTYETFRHHAHDRAPERRLRIGYVSSDFRTHSVAYFMENLLACRNRQMFEIFCYCPRPTADPMTARLQKLADRWIVTTGLTDLQFAQRIYEDGVDILVDLHGHTSGTRLKVFALKPAPVQVTYLGYPDTTGLDAIDYRFTDAYADPRPASGNPTDPPDCFYAEKLIRLPDTFLCYRPPEDAPPVESRPAEGRPLTFVSFNALPKVSDLTVSLWSQILRELPESHMLIKTIGLQDKVVREHLLARFAAQGIAESRLTLLGHEAGVGAHLALYQSGDIALDTFPYHGTTTTCEALWMGVPVITLAGEAHASRVGVSILNNVGLAHLITQTPEAYVAAALDLARDPVALRELHRTLRERLARSPLMDGPGFTRNVEWAYREMWKNWCQA